MQPQQNVTNETIDNQPEYYQHEIVNNDTQPYIEDDGYYNQNVGDEYYSNDPNNADLSPVYTSENVNASGSNLATDNSGISTENSTINSGNDSRYLYSQDEDYSQSNYLENINQPNQPMPQPNASQPLRNSEKIPNYLLSDPEDSQSTSYPNVNNPTISNESDFDFSTNS